MIKKLNSSLSPGEKFWVGLGAYILAADMILWRNGHGTMSQEFGKWLQTRRGRTACLGATAFMVGHLFLELPIPGQTNLKKLATYSRSNAKKKLDLRDTVIFEV